MRRFLMLLALVAPTSVMAIDFDLDGLNLSQSDFESVTRDMTAGFSFKPLNPAEPLGLIGFHVDVFGSYTPTDDPEAWRRITTEKVDEVGMLGISAGKGLILGLDVGAFYFRIPDSDASIVGGELRWAWSEGGIFAPALGFRGAYTKMQGVDDFDFETKSLDVSISKGFALLTPYVGAGYVWGTADPKGNFSLSKADEQVAKLFGGVRISLTVFSIVLEADNTGDNTSYNLRLGLAL